MRGGIEETSASFEARSAPRSYPTRLDAHGQFRHKAPLMGLILHLDYDLLSVAIGEDVPGNLTKGLARLLPSRLNPFQLHADLVSRGAHAVVGVEEVAGHGGSERWAAGDGSRAHPRATCACR